MTLKYSESHNVRVFLYLQRYAPESDYTPTLTTVGIFRQRIRSAFSKDARDAHREHILTISSTPPS